MNRPVFICAQCNRYACKALGVQGLEETCLGHFMGTRTCQVCGATLSGKWLQDWHQPRVPLEEPRELVRLGQCSALGYGDALTAKIESMRKP